MILDLSGEQARALLNLLIDLQPSRSR